MIFLRFRRMKLKLLLVTFLMTTVWLMFIVIPGLCPNCFPIKQSSGAVDLLTILGPGFLNLSSLARPGASNSTSSNSLKTAKPVIKLTRDQLIELEQKRRKNHIQTLCDSQGKNKTEQLGNLGRIIVNDKYKILFCYVPKVACTLWKRVLLALDNRTVKDVHDRKYFKFLYHYPKDGIRFRIKTYYKFLFVREPFERLLSAYQDKFANNLEHWVETPLHSRKMVTNYRRYHPKADANVTFEKFITYVIDDKDKNEHWQTFYDLCHPCHIEYDFIGRFESLQEEADYVLRNASVDKVISFPRVMSHNTSSLLRERFSEVPWATIVRLGKVYQNDFEMFNYSFPGLLSDLKNN